MCIGIPGQIVEIVDRDGCIAMVDVAGVKRNISTAVLDKGGDPAAVGDWVLIHVGLALMKIDEEEAASTYGFLQELSQVYEDDLPVPEQSLVD